MNNLNTVIFAEKPSQARQYAEALGIKKKHKDYIELEDSKYINKAVITWGYGHLVELKLPKEYDKPIDNWQLSNLPYRPDPIEFKVSKDSSSHFKIVKSLFQKADTIINGADIDREGSNIFYTTLRMTGARNKTIKRLWINSLVESEIQKGFLNLRDNKKDILMFKEASSRAISDYLIGMNLSPLYSKLFQEKGIREVFSIGRVQTPTLYMIYERHLAINNFKTEKFYEIIGNFNINEEAYKGKVKFKTKDKNEALNLLEKNNINRDITKGTIKEVNTNQKRKLSPKLHSLSTLQTKMDKLYKYSPEKTKKIAQELYEKKLLSYPRTDSNFITDNEFDYLSSLLDELKSIYNISFENKYLEARKRYVDNNAVQEHYSIIPTEKIPSKTEIDKLNSDTYNVLKEVVSTTLSMFAPDYVYEEKEIITSVNGLDFYSKGYTDLSLGWQALFNKKETDKNKLPNINENDEVQADIEIKEGNTEPPKLYTEGQLINLMKTCGKYVEDKDDSDILNDIKGLGTEATRDNIISTLKDKQYIQIKKNKVYITDKGILLCKAVNDSLLSSPALTAEWEKRLVEIGKGNASSSEFIEITMKFISKELSLFESKKNNVELNDNIEQFNKDSIICKCINCEKGNILEQGKIYKCNNCNQVFFKKYFDNNIPKKELMNLIKHGITKNKIKLKKKNGGTYQGYLKLSDNKEKNIKQYAVTFEK